MELNINVDPHNTIIDGSYVECISMLAETDTIIASCKFDVAENSTRHAGYTGLNRTADMFWINGTGKFTALVELNGVQEIELNHNTFYVLPYWKQIFIPNNLLSSGYFTFLKMDSTEQRQAQNIANIV